jgi:5-methylcytosine-specific restriction endonuclease McrA
MATVAEAVAHVEAGQRQRAARAQQSDKFKKFYKSKAWAKAKYAYMKSLPHPLRCSCCGVTAADERLVVDHVISLRRDWSRRLDPTNFQILCNTHNYICKGGQDDDWRADKIEAAQP